MKNFMKVKNIPLVKDFIKLIKEIKVPGLNSLSFYDLFELYVLGIINGILTVRAGSISFSFFMALFPFLLFILNLIPFIPIDNLEIIVFDFIEIVLPNETQDFFSDIFLDIKNKPRVGLLSSVFILSIFLSANGVSSVFSSFEESYHVQLSRNILRLYLFSIGVSILLAILLLSAISFFVYYEIYILQNIKEFVPSEINLIRLGQTIFFCFSIYFSVSILYYFGTIEGKIAKFFSPGALMTTVLIIISTFFFGIYVEKFSTYNRLYGSIGALLIFMLYIWINSILLLLGFELNATLNRLKKNSIKDNLYKKSEK